MRATLAFIAAIFGTMFLAALLAYPVWLGVHALVPEWAFQGIVGRFWQLLLLIGILLAKRRLGLRGRADWGWGLPRPVFLRQAGAGFAIGVATMLPMTIAMFAFGILRLRSGFGPPMLAGRHRWRAARRPRRRHRRGDVLPRPDVPGGGS